MTVLDAPTKVIRPLTITTAMITSTDLTDSTDEYNSATAYVADDTVKVTGTAGGAASATYKIYTAQGATTGDDPTTDDGTNWVELSSTNDRKLFDTIPQDQSSKSNSMTLTITPGQKINSFSLINVVAQQVQITCTSAEGGGTVYDQTYSLIDDSLIGDWYEFWWEPVAYLSDFVVTDLPTYSDIIVTVTITNTSSDALVGALILGQYAALGSAAIGSQYGLVDYSTTAIDSAGRFTIVAGTYSKRADLIIDCETRLWSGMQSVFHDLRNQPVVWVADESVKGSVIYGYYRNMSIIIANPAITRITLMVQGLTAT